MPLHYAGRVSCETYSPCALPSILSLLELYCATLVFDNYYYYKQLKNLSCSTLSAHFLMQTAHFHLLSVIIIRLDSWNGYKRIV